MNLKEEAVANHLVVLTDAGEVKVDGVLVSNDADFKMALGLDPLRKYPHPLGWSDDWATIDGFKSL